MDKLDKIFEKQKELMVKYKDIERENGLLQTDRVPVDINSRTGQARLKDFCWRIVEELCELMTELKKTPYYGYHEKEIKEEAIDVLHFLVELSILADYNFYLPGRGDKLEGIFNSYRKISDISKDMDIIQEMIYNLGMTAHELKNKPWKQSFKETDVESFKYYLSAVWHKYFQLLVYLGFTSAQEVYDAYMDKNSINKQRQNSGY